MRADVARVSMAHLFQIQSQDSEASKQSHSSRVALGNRRWPTPQRRASVGLFLQAIRQLEPGGVDA